MGKNEKPGEARVSVCTGCAGGGALASALAQEMPVTKVACMNVCTRPACLAVRAEGKAAYLFGDVSEDMTPEIHALLGLYEAAPDGIIHDARPLGALRFCLIGRIPP